jgi:hypothetical protein
MKRIFFTFLLLAFYGSGLIAGDALTLDEAKAMASKTNKPILLDFYTDW